MDVVMATGCLLGGLFFLIMSFYLALCFIQWVGDVIEEKRWRYWR